MTDAVLTVKRFPVTETMKTHPLATLSGITMLAHLVEADRTWTACTRPQRELLAALCPPVAGVLMERGAVTAADMPSLPDRVSAQSRAAMARRGLVDEQGRLTAVAVHAWLYTPVAKGGGFV